MKTDVRQLGLRNSLIKMFHREVMQQSKPEVSEFLEPVQLGQSQAGAAKLVFGVRGLINSRRDFNFSTIYKRIPNLQFYMNS